MIRVVFGIIKERQQKVAICLNQVGVYFQCPAKVFARLFQSALVLQKEAHVIKSNSHFWIDFKRFSIARDRLVQLVLIMQRISHVIISCYIVRLEIYPFSKPQNGLFRHALAA